MGRPMSGALPGWGGGVSFRAPELRDRGGDRAPEEKLPIQIREVNGVHVDDMNVSKAAESEAFEELRERMQQFPRELGEMVTPNPLAHTHTSQPKPPAPRTRTFASATRRVVCVATSMDAGHFRKDALVDVPLGRERIRHSGETPFHCRMV